MILLIQPPENCFIFISYRIITNINLIAKSTRFSNKMSSVAERLTDFRVKLITYMNMKLDEECDIDNLEQLGTPNNPDPAQPETGQEFAIAGYKIIRIRDNICFIWTANSYFLVNLDTNLAHMRLFSTKTEGKLGKAVLGRQESDDIAAHRIRLLFEGQPEKSQSDVPRGQYDILAEPYYSRQDYGIDLAGINMYYLNNSCQIYSYANGRMPEIPHKN